MSERGCFVIDRDVFEEPLLQDPIHFRAYIWLLAEAAWAPRRILVSNGRAEVVLELERGQLSHSLRYMAKAWNVTVKRVRTILHRFEIGSLIGIQTGTLQTIITVCNYHTFQSLGGATGTQSGTQTGTQRARKGHKAYTLNKERGLSPIAPPDRKPEAYTEDDWRERLETYKTTGIWPEWHWGPEPGQPDCLVPRHLLVKPIEKQAGATE